MALMNRNVLLRERYITPGMGVIPAYGLHSLQLCIGLRALDQLSEVALVCARKRERGAIQILNLQLLVCQQTDFSPGDDSKEYTSNLETSARDREKLIHHLSTDLVQERIG